MRIKKMPFEQFEQVLREEWVPVHLVKNCIPEFLQNIPPEILHEVHASGCLPLGRTQAIRGDLLIGGIDVYRNAPDDPVEFNKDWYAVIWNPDEPKHLLVRGPQKLTGDHWLNNVPKRDRLFEVLAVPARPSSDERGNA